MDLSKAEALSAIACAILTAATFANQIWPWPQLKARRASYVDSSVPAARIPKLVSVALLLSFIFSAIAIYSAWNPRYPNWNAELNSLTLVQGQTFGPDDRVVLDGKNFLNCRFAGSTFVYRGTAPFIFNNNIVDFNHEPLRVRIINGPQGSGASVVWGLMTDFCRADLSKCDLSKLDVKFVDQF